MRFLTFLFLPLLCVSVAACGQGRKMNRTNTKKTSSVMLPSINSVTMGRTPCFGKCSIYNITVNKSGLVTYIGENNVAFTGTYQKNIGTTQAAALIKYFEDFRVDTCAENYKPLIADIPGITYTFLMNGVEKKIYNAHFGPPYLSNLAGAVDAVGKLETMTDEWKKVAE